MFALKLISVMLFTMGTMPEISSSDYIKFGGTEDEFRQAANYLSADSGAFKGPTDELIRTQRSFWKKLFKNDLFGECDGCCNNCKYNVENGNNYSPTPLSLLPFQPLRPLSLWRPLQPLFGSKNCDNYGAGGYSGGNSNYGMNRDSNNGINIPSIYNNNVPSAPVHKFPTELPPADTAYTTDNKPVAEDLHEPSSKTGLTENNYTIPEQKVNHKTVHTHQQQSNGIVPQFIYQPIIYVSPQYHGDKGINEIQEENDIKYKEQPKAEEKLKPPSYATETYYENSDYDSDIGNLKIDNQSPNIITLCSKTYTAPDSLQPGIQCTTHPSSKASISTVSTVYNIISPSLLHSPVTVQNPYSGDAVKQSVTPLDNCSLLTQPPIPCSTRAGHPIPLTTPRSIQTYIQPIHLTSEDQPYRVCPELFEEYQRKVNAHSW